MDSSVLVRQTTDVAVIIETLDLKLRLQQLPHHNYEYLRMLLKFSGTEEAQNTVFSSILEQNHTRMASQARSNLISIKTHDHSGAKRPGRAVRKKSKVVGA